MENQFEYRSLPEQDGTAVMYIWQNGYALLANTNNIIAFSPGLKEKFPQYASEIDKVHAEALFARALAHLMLCNTYAQPYNYTANASHLGVPVVDKVVGSNEMMERNSVAKAYERITTDLAAALTILGEPVAPESQSECYYITSRACKALQARVYLYMGRFAEARDCATALIDIMQLTSYEDYVDMMCLNEDSRPGVESIFRLSGLGTNSHDMLRFYYNSSTGMPASASRKLMGTFVETDDVRRSLIVSGDEIIKYRHPTYSSVLSANIYHVCRPKPFRLAEQYLIRAEAYCELNELALAAKDLQTLIGRAIDKNASEINIPYTDKNSLMAIVDRERSLELFAEGHRLFDIIRRKQDMVRDSENTTIYARSIEYPNDKFILPIPYSEIAVNKSIQQNPGY